MALTLEFALANFEVLSQARVVAGHGGLSRELHWAHIVDLPDVAPWVREGDLLLTTAFALKDNPEAQAQLIPVLAEKGLAGMIVALGTYFQDIPAEMIELADRLDFPIVTLPWEVPFVEVTQFIHEYILRGQYAHIEKSLKIHDELTRLVLEGKSLDDIVSSLAHLLDRSVTIEDPALRVLAHASPGPIDEMRRRSIREGRTPQEFVEYLEQHGILDKLKRDPHPQHIPSAPELGMTMERIITPVVVGSQLLGYVWIIATEGPLTELDFLAIEQAATVTALAFTRQQAVFEAEQRVKSNLLDNLIDPDSFRDIRSLRETMARLGLNKGFQVLVLEETERDPLGIVALSALVESELAGAHLPGTLVQRSNRSVLLLGSPDPAAGGAFARSLLDAAEGKGSGLWIGLSSASTDGQRVRQCYVEAMDALRIGKALNAQPGVWPFENLGFLHWGSLIPDQVIQGSRYYRTILSIAEYDRQQGDECLKTLEAYLDLNGNKNRVAETLFIHRNTLRQRLQKIQDLWEIDYDDSYAMMNLYMSLKYWRLNSGQGS